MSLTKAERNQLFEAIVLEGLSVHDFDLRSNAEEMNILHKPTQWLFHVLWKEIPQGLPPVRPRIKLTYRVRTSVGDSGIQNALDFRALLTEYKRWLLRVAHQLEVLRWEAEEPDLWEELKRNPDAFEGNGWSWLSEDNSTFTAQERETILKKLEEIEAVTRDTPSLSDDQRQRIAGDLRYLAEQSTYQKRKEWMNIAKGTVFSWVWEAILPADMARVLVFGVFLQIFQFISGHLPSLPLQPPIP